MTVTMRCGGCLALLDLRGCPEEWAVNVASQFVAAHAESCGYASVAPEDAGELVEDEED